MCGIRISAFLITRIIICTMPHTSEKRRTAYAILPFSCLLRRYLPQLTFPRQNKRRDEIYPESAAVQQRKPGKCQPDDCRIYVEVLTQTSTHPAKLAVGFAFAKLSPFHQKSLLILIVLQLSYASFTACIEDWVVGSEIEATMLI